VKRKTLLGLIIVFLLILAAYYLLFQDPSPPLPDFYYPPPDIDYRIAFLVNDWSVRIGSGNAYSVSGFLIKKNLILTVAHFADYVPLNCRVFLNGRVYKGEVEKVGTFEDAAVIRIDQNDPLLKPFELSWRPLAVGDSVRVSGIHLHPRYISQLNQAINRPDLFVPIVKDYFGFQGSRFYSPEAVYHDLKGVIVDVNFKLNLSNLVYSTERDSTRSLVVRYAVIKLDSIHLGSLGGMSGSAVLRNGRVVGILTFEKAGENLTLSVNNDSLTLPARRTIIATPIPYVKILQF